jgi:tetratricopeptide (TPR) repeat protein
MPNRLFIIAVLFFYSALLLGQNNKQPNIAFDTNYLNAVDHWVVLPKKETDNSYLMGYIYLDEILGITFVFEHTLTLDLKEAAAAKTNLNSFSSKKKLDAATPFVYLLPLYKITQLHLPEKPEWIEIYDRFEKSTADLVLKGYQYNAIGKSNLALPFLEKAYEKEPLTKNLAFELSYAYNATEQYEKAVGVLNEAIKLDSKNFMLYRELGFSFLKTERIEAAENIYEKGVACCENATEKRAMAIDMAQLFFELKDQLKFEKWTAILKTVLN